MAKWIKIEDRLPTRDEDVLIYDGETISVGYHDGRVFMDYMNQDDMRVYSNSKVTHWMPIPDPPKNEKTRDEYVSYVDEEDEESEVEEG